VTAESELQLAAAERAAHLGRFSWDVVHDVVHMSDSMCRLLAVEPAEELTFAAAVVNIHPEDLASLEATLRHAIEAGQPYVHEARAVGPDGEVRFLRGTGQPVLDSAGTTVALVGIVQDITEARRAEEALRDSEQRFRLLAENARDVVYRYLPEPVSRFDYISPSIEFLSGYPPEDFYADHALPRRLIHPDDHVLLRPDFQPAPIRGIRRDGSTVWVELQSVAVRDADGHVTAIEGIARDVTERKRAEDELRLLQTITLAVSEASDMHSALAVALQRVCETTGWTYGGAWVPRGDDTRLVPSPAWYGSIDGLERLQVATRAMVLEPGEGLPGRTWKNATAEWVSELAEFDDGPRRAVLAALGMRTAVAVPVLDNGRVITVLEFFLAEQRFEDAHLLDLVTGAAAQLGNVFTRREAEARLAHQAKHDPVTGLGNRELFIDQLTRCLVRSEMLASTLSVLCVNIDGFKRVNESLGHRTGDRLLQAVADRLSRVVRPDDLIARLGGDEFVVLADDIADEHDAMAIAHRIRDGLGAPFALEQRTVYLTASIGMALAGDGRSLADSLVRDANAAMHSAKEKGRGACQLFDKVMHSRSIDRLEMEQDLRSAIEEGQFRLVYQPEVDLTTGGVIGVEGLLRWRHPVRGDIPPLEFIPLAEETGLILTIGDWVLRQACEQAALWNATRRNGSRVCVWTNLSARQLIAPDLVARVAAALVDSGAAPSTIGLEITESVLMDDAESSLRTLHELRDLGVRLAIDDFGTGYSSLAYLKRLPVEVLKIDRAFVRGLGDDPDDSTIVAAVISLAHSLGVAAVAEGVETWTQLTELDLLGCDVAQGFYFARPADASDVMLASRYRTLRRANLTAAAVGAATDADAS
jgi:diguanylate cyclase (GGDEF)-like protein/PAS domain S-box-containing protein